MANKSFLFKIFLILLLVGFVLFWIAFNTMLNSNHEEQLNELRSKVGLTKSSVLPLDNGEIHFVLSGDTTKEPVLLIHGSPGSWDAWMEVMSDTVLLERYYFISVDRPGFGLTTIPSMRNLVDHSEAIYSVVKKIESKIILMGHSYGGAVAQQLALDHSAEIKALIYVAATLEPSAQKPKWYNHFANTKIISALLSKSWNASGNEMMGLSENLEANEVRVKDLKIPTILIQGMKDILVPPSTIDYYKKVEAQDYVEYKIDPEENHFIPWTKPGLIREVLINFTNTGR